jgi:hypothetical protein
MTAGYIPLAASATTITGSSHLDDGITLGGVVTSSEPFLVDYSSATRTYAEIYNAVGHAWFLNSTGSSGYASAPANSLAFQDESGMETPLYLTASSVVALQPVSMPTGSTVNSENICLADGTGCPATVPVYTGVATAGSFGTGVSSVTCLTATCNNLRGSFEIVPTTFTQGNVFSLTWSATPTAYICTVEQNGDVGGGLATIWYGVGHTIATTTGMTITVGVTPAGTVFVVDYSGQP